MTENNSSSDIVSKQVQWYWYSEKPEGLFVDETTPNGATVFNYNPSTGWQPYSKTINEWLERGLSLMKKSNNIDDDVGVLRIGLFLPLINGALDYSWSDMAIDFCNGIVMIDRSNYVNINQMKQYDKYNIKEFKQVKREPPIENMDDYYFHSQEEIIGQMLTSTEIKTDIIHLEIKMKKATHRSEYACVW